MKRALPLWLAAVVPATLAGHALAYALSGRAVSDGHHLWLAPAMQSSLALLFAVCSTLAAATLLRSGVLVHTPAERSWLELWMRLAPAQLLLFILIERSEGTPIGIAGIAVQVVAAFCTAYLLSLFSSLLVQLAEHVELAARYNQRRPQHHALLSPRPLTVAYALAVRAGSARFQRPPP